MPSANDKAEHTKNLIANKAKEVFCQKGYFQASMEVIRSHSGMSKGSIYYHFKSKEDLFMYILELYVKEWLTKWEEKSSKLKTAKDKLYALADHFALEYKSPINKASMEFAICELADTKIKEKIDELNRLPIPITQKILIEGIQNKEFKNIDVNEITLITYSFLCGIGAIAESAMTNIFDFSNFYKKSIDIFLEGLAT